MRVTVAEPRALSTRADRYAVRVTRELRLALRATSRSLPDRPTVDDLVRFGTEWSRRVDEDLLPELARAHRDAAAAVRTQLAGTLTATVELADDAATRYALDRRNVLIGIGDVAWQHARELFIEDGRRGASPAELRRSVTDALGPALPHATTRARTELAGAVNNGALEAVLATDVTAEKTWLAVNDDATRTSHQETDGQTVEVGALFDVSGTPMRCPHDPTAPGSETENCRCSVAFDVPTDEVADETIIGSARPLTASADVANGSMIALVPSDADLDRLTINGYELREILHLTLWYLGDAADHPANTQDELVNAITSMIENRSLPRVVGRAFGANLWNADGDEPAWVLQVGDTTPDERPEDQENLAVVREMISEAWHDGMVMIDVPDQYTPWVPHVCLAYSDDPELLPELVARLGPITFDRVRVAFAGRDVDVSLG